MRLLDQVAQACAPTIIVGPGGRHRLPGSAERSGAVATCPLRFVLEGDAAARCRRLLAEDRRVLAAGDMPACMPAPAFWVEWTEEDGRRTGVLVEAEADGRSGTIETFWEQATGEPHCAQAIVRFDLDCPIAAEIDGDGCVALRPAAHPLARHLIFAIDPAWCAHFLEEGEAAALRAVEVVASNVVPGIEMLLAFATLLGARPVLAMREVDQGRLNRHRRRSGRVALLDHLTVRLDLDAVATAAAAGQGPEARASARLHRVRGHMVRRGGRAFWRRPHLRGEAARPIAGRTVRVTAGA